MLHPQNNRSCVRYYYLAARNGNCAEIIVVLNSQRCNVDVPVWEEDIILEPFHTRPITTREEQACRGAEIWKVFTEWEILFEDHHKYGVGQEQLLVLGDHRNKLDLTENMVA